MVFFGAYLSPVSRFRHVYLIYLYTCVLWTGDGWMDGWVVLSTQDTLYHYVLYNAWCKQTYQCACLNVDAEGVECGVPARGPKRG